MVLQYPIHFYFHTPIHAYVMSRTRGCHTHPLVLPLLCHTYVLHSRRGKGGQGWVGSASRTYHTPQHNHELGGVVPVRP